MRVPRALPEMWCAGWGGGGVGVWGGWRPVGGGHALRQRSLALAGSLARAPTLSLSHARARPGVGWGVGGRGACSARRVPAHRRWLRPL